MSDISLPWTILPFLPYVVTPIWALVGAIAAFALIFRWKRSWGKALAAAVVGSQLLPWLVLLTVGTWDDARGGTVRVVGLGCLGALVLLVVWLRASHPSRALRIRTCTCSRAPE